jgi:hypothetical protein
MRSRISGSWTSGGLRPSQRPSEVRRPCEDIDVVQRAVQKGWKVMYDPSLPVWHTVAPERMHHWRPSPAPIRPTVEFTIQTAKRDAYADISSDDLEVTRTASRRRSTRSGSGRSRVDRDRARFEQQHEEVRSSTKAAKAGSGRQNSTAFGTSPRNASVGPPARQHWNVSAFADSPSNCTSLRVPNARAAGHGRGAAFLQRWAQSLLTRWTIAEQPLSTR